MNTTSIMGHMVSQPITNDKHAPIAATWIRTTRRPSLSANLPIDTDASAEDISTYMELVQGMRNKDELNSLRKALHGWNAKILYISEEISVKAMFFVEQHYLNHSIQLADALIGATAIAYGLPILTGNDKHYKILNDLQLRKFRP